ncbi:MAG: hypothetical protein H6702_10200 [Myxococcales bacterium]|nr:hypothetical protein [Myxococcales bacterium]
MWWSIGMAALGLVLSSPPLHLGGKTGRAQHLKRLELSPTAEDALRLAQGLGRERHVRDALMWLRRAQARGAHPLRVALVRADVFRDAGRPAEAASAYLEVIEQAPHNPHAHLALWALLRDARWPEAVDRARLRAVVVAAGYALGEAPARPRATEAAREQVAAGETALRAGDFQAAVARFEAAVALDDDLAEAFHGLGEAWLRLGQRERAAAAWRIFLMLSPRDTRQRRMVQRAVDDVERHRGLAAPSR